MKKLCGILLAGIFFIAPRKCSDVGRCYSGIAIRDIFGVVMCSDPMKELWPSRVSRWDSVKRVCL